MSLDPAPSSTTVRVEEKYPRLSRQRAYRIWWLADTSALLAGNIYQFILPLLLLAATGSPAQAGLLAALGLLARASLTLTGGAMADRADRSRLIVLGGLCGAFISGALALAAFSGSLSAAVLCIGHILMELRGGFFGSVTNAALKDVVHPTQLGKAMAANQGRDSAISLGAAPLGGALLGLGAGAALLLVSLMQVASSIAGRLLSAPMKQAMRVHRAPENLEPLARGAIAGLKWCLTRPQLRSLLILIVIVNLGTNGMVTTLIYGLQQRGEPAWLIGLISTTMGVGMLLGSLLAAKLIDSVPTGSLTCICLTTLGAGIILMGLGDSLWWMGSMLALAFFSVPALNAGAGGFFMAVIPQQMAGRASALITFMALLALPLSPLLAGLGIQAFGMGPTLIFFGSLVILSAIFAWLDPLVRKIPGTDQWNDSQLESASHEQAPPSGGARKPQTASLRRFSNRTHHGKFPDPYGSEPITIHRPLPPTEQWNYL